MCRPAHEAPDRHRRWCSWPRGVLRSSAWARAATAAAYRVRAIFDNAGFVITGEDVKIAGAKVGTIDSLDVTPDKQGGGRR